MASSLVNKKIVLGISGSIAAYKSVDWIRLLREEGAEVTTVMTAAGTRFVTPLTLAALSGQKVYYDMFDNSTAFDIPHINLARNCDLILLAPATAQTIARLAHGLADDLLSTIILATSSAKVIICPAMNSKMYLHGATQSNIGKLKQYGYIIVEPDTGSMACGEEGPGRLASWQTVRQAVLKEVTSQDLQETPILITAGPTHEPLDPVRFIGNRSTGKMGYALAATAGQRGGKVTLISGPSDLKPPAGVNFIQVTTADEMHKAVLNCAKQMSVIVKAAAVSDYRPTTTACHKIKKGNTNLNLSLTANRDILKELGKRQETTQNPPLLIGFAAESQNHLANGRRKLAEKNLDLIIINDISNKERGFAADSNQITIIDKNGGKEELPLLSKEETAHRIWDKVSGMISPKAAI